MVKKVKGGYEVIGNNTGKDLGKFASKEAAKNHEQQVRYFMYADKSKGKGKK